MQLNRCMLRVSCAGLVFPRFAASKAEMVAAGVIPIDRLTDIRAPVDVVAMRCGQPQLESVYGIQLGPRTLDAASASTDSSSAAGVDGSSSSAGSSLPAGQAAAAAKAAEQVQLSMGTRLLVSLARARGWAASAGLPDEARAGRQILKDYTNGKLLYCKLPPASQRKGFAPVVAPLPGTVNAMQLDQQRQAVQVGSAPQQPQQLQPVQDSQVPHQQQQESGSADASSSSPAAAQPEDVPAGEAADASGAAAADGIDGVDASTLLLSEADLELMEGLGVGPKSKAKRPEHKFHKKAARSKGTRGLQADAGGYDGAALSTGKKGGLVRVGGY